MTIVKSLSALTSAMALYLAFIYVAGVLLLQFLAGRLSHCSDPHIHLRSACVGPDASNAPRRWTPSVFNCDWLGPSLLTALAISSGNAWGSSMARGLNAAQREEGPVFRESIEMFSVYLLLVLAGRFLFANLFLGVLAQSYGEVSKDRRHEAAINRGHQERLKKLAHLNHETAMLIQRDLFEPNPLGRQSRREAAVAPEGARLPPRKMRSALMKGLLANNKKRKAIQEQVEDAKEGGGEGDDDLEDMVARKLTRKDLPLLFVEPKSRLRAFFFRVLGRKELETLVLVSILLNAGCSGLMTLRASSLQLEVAAHAEYVLSGIFSLELTLRLLAYHPRAFLESSWNCLDCVLVLATAAALCLTSSPPHLQPFESPISPQLLRTARAFRAARLIQFAPAVMGAMAEALPKMITLLLLGTIVLFGCASMGVSMLSNLCLFGDELTGDNALRCQLVNDEGKLPLHSNFRNTFMALLTLVRFSTGEGWLEVMHRSSLVSHDFERSSPDAVQQAASALQIYRNLSMPSTVREAALFEARLWLPGCVTSTEMQQLQELGVIACMSYSFNTQVEVPCQGTCGTNLSKFAIPIFSLVSTFMLLNLSAAIMIESLRMASRFAGHRALLSKKFTKKRLKAIWEVWDANARARGRPDDNRPEIGHVLLTIQRAVDLPKIYFSRDVQTYVTCALHSGLLHGRGGKRGTDN